MVAVMAVMSKMSRVLHAVADHAAEDCSRRSGDERACHGADRRATGPAAMFRPVVAERAGGRHEKCRAEHGCTNSLMDQGCHHDLLTGEYCERSTNVTQR